jgi:hypothetical protein
MWKLRKYILFSRFKSSYFERKYVLCLFIVLVFCIVDGTMTISLIERGAWEANPLMRYALSVSHEFFFLIKYFLTAGGLMYLMVNGERRVFGGLLTLEEVVWGVLVLYEGLVIYEVVAYYLTK